MLEYLRNASEKPVAKFLIALLAFSFVGWGVVDWMNGANSTDTLVTVGDAPISVSEFEVEKSRAFEQMGIEKRRQYYADKKLKSQVINGVLTTLVSQKLAENRARDLEIVANVNGRALVAPYMLLEHLNMPMPVPEFAVRASYDARYAERNIEYATVKYADFDVANPSDEQLRDFYAQNPQNVPETRAVSYVLINVDKNDMDASYQLARLVEDDIVGGESFKDVAKKHKVKYGHFDAFDVNHRPVDKLLTDTNVALIFDMDENLESEMIEFDDKLVFFIVDKINPASVAEFDSVKKSLVKQWKVAEQKKRAYVRANELLVDLNAGGKLAGGKAAQVSRAKGAPDEVLVAAFRGNVVDNSIVPGTDAYYVLSVKDTIAPKADKKKMAAMRKEMEGLSAKSVLDDYNSFLKRTYPIQINERNYNALIGE